MNVSNNKVIGFDDESLSFTQDLKDILAGCEVKEGSVAKYVNQWVYRSTHNEIFLLEFWFNAGSLPGEELLMQLDHVIRACEIIGLHVDYLCSDAGGGNVKLFSILRNLLKTMDVPDDFWLDLDQISFTHPLDKSRRIFFLNCITHLLKSMRNQLYGSRNGGANKFYDKKDQSVGWEAVVQAFEIEKNQIGGTCSKLTSDSVYLKGWSKMNVSFALRPSEFKTLVEMLLFCEKTLMIILPTKTLYEENRFFKKHGSNLKNW